jgi:hypothetical protein
MLPAEKGSENIKQTTATVGTAKELPKKMQPL